MALCDRCGEEIAVANDLDQAGDIDRRRHMVMVAGSRRSLIATHWQIFMLLYRHRGDVVYNDRIHAELSEGRDRPSAELIREHMRQLRKVLAGSRYQIVNYRSLGYELIVADAPDASATAPARPPREVTVITAHVRHRRVAAIDDAVEADIDLLSWPRNNKPQRGARQNGRGA